MSVTDRLAVWDDLKTILQIQGQAHSLEFWKPLIGHPSVLAAVLEARPAINGHSIVGFGFAAIVSTRFAEAEFGNFKPYILSRLLAGLHAGEAVLATREEVGRANAGAGIDVILPHTVWRDAILSDSERHDIQTVFVRGFTERIRGYRIRRILQETTSQHAQEFLERSKEFERVAEFNDLGRYLFLMTTKSATAMPGSVGNQIFRYEPPVFMLRESEQALLLAATEGATDAELASQLGVTPAAVKARWRSVYARIGEVMPILVQGNGDGDGRGNQKRHRVLGYIRGHTEELRPFDWRERAISVGAASG